MANLLGSTVVLSAIVCVCFSCKAQESQRGHAAVPKGGSATGTKNGASLVGDRSDVRRYSEFSLFVSGAWRYRVDFVEAYVSAAQQVPIGQDLERRPGLAAFQSILAIYDQAAKKLPMGDQDAFARFFSGPAEAEVRNYLGVVTSLRKDIEEIFNHDANASDYVRFLGKVQEIADADQKIATTIQDRFNELTGKRYTPIDDTIVALLDETSNLLHLHLSLNYLNENLGGLASMPTANATKIDLGHDFPVVINTFAAVAVKRRFADCRSLIGRELSSGSQESGAEAASEVCQGAADFTRKIEEMIKLVAIDRSLAAELGRVRELRDQAENLASRVHKLLTSLETMLPSET